MPEILSPLGDGDRRKANEYSRKTHEEWRRRQRESERDRQRESEQDRRHSRPSPGPDRREPRDREPPRSRSRPRPYPDSKPTEEPRPSSSRQSQDTNPDLKRWATDLIFTLKDWTCSSIRLTYKILLLTWALLPIGLLKSLMQCVFIAALVLSGIGFACSFFWSALGPVLCELATSTPFILESARQFVCSSAFAESPTDQAQFIVDSLDGFGPVVPDILTYMANVGEDVEDKANEMKDLLEVSDIDLSSAQWKSDYKRATELLRAEESTFRDQQQQLWMEIDRYLRQFTHSSKQADTSFWSYITGGNTSGQLKIAKQQNSALLSILAQSHNKTVTTFDKIPADRSKGIYGMIYNADVSTFSRNIDNFADQHGTADGMEGLHSAATILSTANEALAESLERRGEMLKADKLWLTLKQELLQYDMTTLHKGRQGLAHDAWVVRLEEIEQRTWNIAIEWRERLKAYFVPPVKG